MILNRLYCFFTQKKETEQQQILSKINCRQDDFTKEHQDIIDYVIPYTMTSPERLFSLIEAIKYLDKNNIAGDIVECGVWRGGSMMAAAIVLNQLDNKSRNIYLYDTFEGMPPPSSEDRKYSGESATQLLKERKKNTEDWLWAYASLEDVKNNFSLINFDTHRLHFIKGKVEDKIPTYKPEKIALLRLDTDWYSSTKWELEHLYPCLSSRGILIIDDYGHWQGCKKAVDEYFEHIPVFLNRVDYTCRLIVKP